MFIRKSFLVVFCNTDGSAGIREMTRSELENRRRMHTFFISRELIHNTNCCERSVVKLIFPSLGIQPVSTNLTFCNSPNSQWHYTLGGKRILKQCFGVPSWKMVPFWAKGIVFSSMKMPQRWHISHVRNPQSFRTKSPFALIDRVACQGNGVSNENRPQGFAVWAQ